MPGLEWEIQPAGRFLPIGAGRMKDRGKRDYLMDPQGTGFFREQAAGKRKLRLGMGRTDSQPEGFQHPVRDGAERLHLWRASVSISCLCFLIFQAKETASFRRGQGGKIKLAERDPQRLPAILREGEAGFQQQLLPFGVESKAGKDAPPEEPAVHQPAFGTVIFLLKPEACRRQEGSVCKKAALERGGMSGFHAIISFQQGFLNSAVLYSAGKVRIMGKKKEGRLQG